MVDRFVLMNALLARSFASSSRASIIALLAACFGAPNLSAQNLDPSPGYYDSATGTGSTLASQLHDIIDDHTVLNYNSARSTLQIIDADPNQPGHIILAYTNESLDLTPLSGNSIPGWDSGSSWNREHTWPRTRSVGSSGPDNTDLHQLRPSDPGINGSRNNLNFGGAYGLGSAGRVDDGAGTVWYPGDQDAGLIARQQFYMDVRYDGSDSSTEDLTLASGNPASGGPQMGDLNRLIEWHFADPVDNFERTRTSGIENDYQGNRNPFIDRPEFAWSVFVDQQNDSRIELSGGSTNSDGGSTLDLDRRIITGSGGVTAHTVTLNKSGLDGTYYSVSVSGSATSELNGSFNAFQTNQVGSATFEVDLNASTETPGISTGSITIDNLDITSAGGIGRGSNDADDTINLSLAVLDHAQPSLNSTSNVVSQVIDLGDFFIGSQYTPSISVELFNLAAAAGDGLTANLDLDAIVEVDAADKFSFANNLFTDLQAGSSESILFDGLSDALGTYVAEYDLLVSDEDIAGEANSTLELSLSFDVVAEVGDFSISGNIDDTDIDFYSGQLGQTVDYQSEFRELDLDGDGTITLADHDLHVNTLVETSIGIQGTLIGDVNLDGQVNLLGDAFILLGNLDRPGTFGFADGDLNADGTVDLLNDAFRLLANLGNGSGSSSLIATTAIPEPANSTLMLAMAIAFASTRNRKR